jgi:hypothetical protein
MVYDRRATPLVAADITTPRIPYGDAIYNFSSVWTDWNGQGLFADELEAWASAIATMDVESCLFLCAFDLSINNVQTIAPYAGLEDAK